MSLYYSYSVTLTEPVDCLTPDKQVIYDITYSYIYCTVSCCVHACIRLQMHVCVMKLVCLWLVSHYRCEWDLTYCMSTSLFVHTCLLLHFQLQLVLSTAPFDLIVTCSPAAWYEDTVQC